MRFMPLPHSFFEPSASVVAPALLGHWLIRRTSEGVCGGPIVETEAYVQGDQACHAAPGLTARNQVMFGPPGRAYVYFIYGAHYCVNAVCQPTGVAEALLIRALEASFGVELLRRRRPIPITRMLTNGPAKLCEAMDIDRSLNGTDLCNAESPLIIARNPEYKRFRAQRGPLVIGPRVGISKAADLPLRFLLASSEFVSPAKPLGRGRVEPTRR